MLNLTITPAQLILRPKDSGKGYDLYRSGEHHAVFTVGNVSVAFDGRNEIVGGVYYDDEVISLSEYRDCPVRLNGMDCPDCDSPAEALLFALAADLGYIVSRNDGPGVRYSVTTGEEL